MEKTIDTKKTTQKEEKEEVKEILKYTNKQELFNKLVELLPNVELEKTATIDELVKLGENHGYKFVKE